MGQPGEESQNVLFVYFQDDSGHFWVYDDGLYHRFLWSGEGVRFVRSQSYLPKFTVGMCALYNDTQRQALEDEAARVNLQIRFFESEDECIDDYLLMQHDQMIFDRTVPGGFFYLNNGMKRSRDNEGDSEN